LAERHGARLKYDEPIRRWTSDGAGVRVETATGVYRAARLVLTAGPWANSVLADLGLPLTVTRMYNVFFEPSSPARFQPSAMPIYGWELPEGEYYGVPALPGQGLKIGRHDAGDICTPETARREVTRSEIEALCRVLDRVMPGAAGQVRSTLTCLYTLTPDHHFVIDRHPVASQVVYGCGFSGHGFKFASVVGEILADLAVDGRSRLPIDFLRAGRFAGHAAAVQS
jgi:sarcosine oxidase